MDPGRPTTYWLFLWIMFYLFSFNKILNVKISHWLIEYINIMSSDKYRKSSTWHTTAILFIDSLLYKKCPSMNERHPAKSTRIVGRLFWRLDKSYPYSVFGFSKPINANGLINEASWEVLLSCGSMWKMVFVFILYTFWDMWVQS